MQAILNDDIIINLVIKGGTEIGNIPKGVGLERLRFDGEKVIDLAELSAIWVRHIESNAFELHCVDVGNCQLVEMSYRQRRLLISNTGTYRIKTKRELEIDRVAEANQKSTAKMIAMIQSGFGCADVLQVHLFALIVFLIVYEKKPKADLFDNILPDIVEMFPVEKWEPILIDSVKKLKIIMKEYNSKRR